MTKRTYSAPRQFIVVAIISICIVYPSVLLYQKYVLKTKSEVFPFFSWSLFSSPVSDNKIIKYYIDIKSAEAGQGRDNSIVPAGDLSYRVRKAIKNIERRCDVLSKNKCDLYAQKVLRPFLIELPRTLKDSFEVEIIKCVIDGLRFRKHIENSTFVGKLLDLCEGKQVVGRWVIRK